MSVRRRRWRELKDGLDQIWNAPPERTSGFWYFVRKRLLSVGIDPVSRLSVAGVARLQRPGECPSPHVGADRRHRHGASGLNFLFSFALVTLLFAMIYKILPSVRIAWKDVAIGSVITAALFTVGKALIGVYLGNSAGGVELWSRQAR